MNKLLSNDDIDSLTIYVKNLKTQIIINNYKSFGWKLKNKTKNSELILPIIKHTNFAIIPIIGIIDGIKNNMSMRKLIIENAKNGIIKNIIHNVF